VRISWLRRSLRVFVGVLALAGLAVAVAACGSNNNSSTSASTGAQQTSGGKQGGTLTLVSSGDVDNNLDPGYSYYQFDFILDNALHR
jgi:ABC-type transport system substrate-binding protein